MNRIIIDLRHAVRLTRQRPAFSIAAVVILALGIGANTALFSVVNGVLLRPLPFPDGDRLYWISETSSEGGTGLLTSFENFSDWRGASESFQSMSAYAFDNFNLTGGRSPEQLRAARVAGGFFEVLGIKPLLGRTFDSAENGVSPAPVVILSERLWRRQFGADPSVLGSEVELDGKPWTVTGVMPSSFDFPVGWDIWVPLGDLHGKEPRDTRRLWTFGRLRPGVSARQAQDEMKAIAATLENRYPRVNEGRGIGIVSIKERLVGDLRPTILLLFGAVAVVLLIACANIANLLLAKSRRRQREICLRLAMGASRKQIVGQLLIESLFLATLGGLLGWSVALWSLDGILALAPSDLPRLGEVQMDWRVFAFSMVAAVASGLLFGLLPAWQAGRSDLASAFKEGGRSSTGQGIRARRLLAAGQMALAVALLSGAALISRSLYFISAQEPGFSRNVLSMGLVLPPNEYPKASQRVAFFEEALARLNQLPGPAGAASANFLPTFGQAFQVKAHSSQSSTPHAVEQRVVTPGFFSTLEIPLLAGRDFEAGDRSDTLAVGIVNRAAAELFWPGVDPLGKELVVAAANGKSSTCRVVGLVENVRPGGLTTAPIAELYVPYSQNAWGYMNLVVRSREEDALQLLPAAREALWQIDPRRPFFSESTLGDALDRISLAEPRFRALLLGSFAALAGLLAVVGLYGVIAYTVSGRRREIATRMALGARPDQVLRLVLGEGLAMAGAGLAIGIVITLLGGRLLAGLLYGVTPSDPATLAAAVALLTLPAIWASAVPALRAARTDPARVLRRD